MKLRVVCISVMMFLLIGCQPSLNPKEVSEAPFLSNRTVTKQINPLFFDSEAILQLNVPFEQFSSIVEWLNDETVLYTVDTATQSEVHTFNIRTGETSLFFVSDYPVLSVEANAAHKLFVIQTAPSFSEGNISVVDSDGELVTNWSFPASQDLVYSWNPYTDKQIAVSSFLEDWSYEGFLLDVVTKEKVEQEFANPFIQWIEEKKVGYIKWNQDEPSLSAPLYTFDLVTGNAQQLIENVIMFSAFSDYIMTVTNNSVVESMADYTFMKVNDVEVKKQFTAPLLSMYSNYLTPFYEYVDTSSLFYTFFPEESGSIESYTKAFQLVTFDVRSGELEVQMEGLENKPLKFSPNGVYCLYGHQFEQLIVIPNKKVVDLIDYS
ncbi:YqgU-like beta propeller domain-containing protein [Sutcliffiella halmapala]|uniref:YqgU-like beta propeller domain-containing protein n=1 Tax=Sutcliffiella halmapala TaxID=79882 RepID=UPI00099533A1|nr:hypothetical protein [Sutcliffiella halmapala]